jgi:AcrR family transcriptional regulator
VSADLGNRRTKRSLKTREAILDAAAQVFAEHGYEAASLDAVAAGAGVTKGTVYYHFDAKEAIYLGVVLRYLADALARLRAAVEETSGMRAAIERIIDDQIDDTLSPATRYVHYQEILSVGDEIHRTVRVAQRQYEYAFAEVLRSGQEAGVVMPGEPHLIANLLIGTIGRTARWYSPEGKVSEQEFRDMLKTFLFSGLFPASS